MKLLLHTCCAPCLEYPMSVLEKDFIEFNPFFYNPNIHPFWEYNRRKETLMKLAKKNNLQVIYMSPEDHTLKYNVSLYEKIWSEYSTDMRCNKCYSTRLHETAVYAMEHGYDSFSTTLLLSTYQNHNVIKSLGEAIESELNHKIHFYYRDFREGFRKSQIMAKEDGLYRQKYCGCICSLNNSTFKDKIYFQAKQELGFVQ